MKPCAAAVIAGRPTAGGPPLMVSEPRSAKNAATLAARWLHHAAVYLAANGSRDLFHPAELPQAVSVVPDLGHVADLVAVEVHDVDVVGRDALPVGGTGPP